MTTQAVLRKAQECSGEVTAFAADLQVQTYLSSIVDMTHRIFPAAQRINTVLDEDPEIVTDRHIVFEVQLPTFEIGAAVAARERWHRDLGKLCPAPLAWVFRLDLEPAH